MTLPFMGFTRTEANANLDALWGTRPINDIRSSVYAGGADPSGVADARAALAAADAAVGALAMIGTYRVGSNLTLNKPFTPVAGALLRPDNGVVVTINAPPSAGGYKWIDTSAGGSVVFAPAAGAVIDAGWWGLSPWDLGALSGGDNTAALQAFAASITGDISNGWKMRIPSGAYYLKHGFRLTRSFTTLEMLGVTLVFDPTADGEVCVDWNRGTELSACKMIGGQIQSPTTNTVAKIGVRLVDVSDFDMDKVSTHNSFTSNGRKDTNPSIGLVIEGREVIHVRRSCVFVADRPIQVSRNPNARIELDTCVIEPQNLTILGTHEAALLIDDGCALLNTELLPTGAMEGGKDGVLWVNQAGHAITSTNVVIGPFRQESTTDVEGHAVNIQTDASQLIGLEVNGVQPAFTNHGLLLRGVNGGKVKGFRYTGNADSTRKTIDIDNSNREIAFENTTIQLGNGYSITGMRLAVATGLSTDLLLPSNFVLRQDAQADVIEFMSDPTAGGGIVFSLKGGTRKFRLQPGVFGVSNDGLSIYDITNGKLLFYIDTLNKVHAGQGGLIVDQSGAGVASTVYAFGADNIRYKLVPPNGGGAANWVAG